MAENKTQKTRASVRAFLDAIPDKQRRADCKALDKMMRESTGAKPALWGDSIVGYGDLHYRYASGREGEWFVVGFSPRKSSLTLYLMCDLDEQKKLLEKLGKHKTGRSCLYVNQLADVDSGTLRKLVDDTVRRQKKAG